MPGLPLSEHSLVSYLTSHGIVCALGHVTNDQTRVARFDALWNHKTHPGVFSKEAALALVSSNVLKLLGIKPEATGERSEWAAVRGEAFGLGGKVVAVSSAEGTAIY